MQFRRQILTAAMVLAAAHVALAREYKDPEGFSFTVPDRWVISSKNETDALFREIKSRNPRMADLDMTKIAVMALDPNQGNFADNMNVVVVSESVRVNQASLTQYNTVVRDQMSKVGATVGRMKSEIIQVADRDALSISWVTTYPGADGPAAQWQVVVPGGSKTYIITFSSSEKGYPAAEGTFRQILSTFSAPKGLPTWAIGSLVGAIIGGMIGLVTWLRKNKQKKASVGTYGQPVAAGAALEAPQAWNPQPSNPQSAAAPQVYAQVPLAPAAAAPPAAPTQPQPVQPAPADNFIRFSCPCGKKLKVSPAYSGKQCQCPACKAKVRIP